jgi:hypothetical protein
MQMTPGHPGTEGMIDEDAADRLLVVQGRGVGTVLAEVPAAPASMM